MAYQRHNERRLFSVRYHPLRTQWAVKLFEEAKQANFADAIIYKTTLDALAKSAQPDPLLAETLMDEAIGRFKLDNMSGRHLDLHGLSFGMVYFGLKRRIQREISTGNPIATLTVIYGKGLHSRSGEDIHPVKQAVLCVVNELSGQGVSGQEHELNSGVFKLSLQPMAVHYNVSTSPGLFARQRPPLNPNAKTFVPSHNWAPPSC